MNNDNNTKKATTLPRYARLPINRCSLPPQIIGSLTFQNHPVPLAIDGVATLHRQLFELLDKEPSVERRAARFIDYMTVQFRLHELEDAGLTAGEDRGNADYLRLLRGWLFDADSREGAVLKGWVESRFGLLPRYHRQPLRDFSGNVYLGYVADRSAGLYGTNALEAQLDLLYSYCQYELARQTPAVHSIRLYRGINDPNRMEVLERREDGQQIILMNSLNSFSRSRERAEEFGDYIMDVVVPTPKVLFYSGLLPRHHIGEDEYLVIGGVYAATLSYW